MKQYTKFQLDNMHRKNIITAILKLQKENERMDKRLKKDYNIIEELRSRLTAKKSRNI